MGLRAFWMTSDESGKKGRIYFDRARRDLLRKVFLSVGKVCGANHDRKYSKLVPRYPTWLIEGLTEKLVLLD